MAVGVSSVSAAVLTALVIAVVSVAVAWATGGLRPPVVEEEAGRSPAADPA